MNSTDNGTYWFMGGRVPMYFIGGRVAIQMLWMMYIIMSNGIVLFAIAKYKLWKKSYNVFIIGLAITDVTVGCVVLPIDIWRKLVVRVLWSQDGTPSGLDADKAGCLFLIFLTLWPMLCAYVTVMLISIDRFISILFPLRHHAISSPMKNGVSVLLGFASTMILLGVSCICGIYDGVPYDSYTTRCNYNILPSKARIAVTLLSGVFPISTSYICHGVVAYKAIKRRNAIAPANHADANKFKIAKGTIFILGTFTLCVLPAAILKALPTVTQNYTLTIEYLDFIFVDIMYFNSVLNPIIYTYSYIEIRKGVFNVIRLILRKTKIESLIITSSTTSNTDT